MVVVIVVMMMMLAKGFFEARVSEPEENFPEKFPGEIFCWRDSLCSFPYFAPAVLTDGGCRRKKLAQAKEALEALEDRETQEREKRLAEVRQIVCVRVCVCVCVRVYFRVCGFSHICVFAVCVFACARVSPIVFCGKRLPQNSDGGPRRHDR